MPRNVRDLMLNLVAVVIVAAFSLVLPVFFPDLRDDDLRSIISGTACIVLLLVWFCLVRPRLKRFAHWLARQWRYLVLSFLLILLEALLYLVYHDWKVIVFSIGHFALIAATTLLLARPWMKRLGEEVRHRKEFFEDFQHGLENWEFDGNWRTEKDGDQSILIVAKSERGGIAKPCRSWTDYVFEFETKIVNHNTSWIIRANDTANYVMLQCGQDQLNPHFRAEIEGSELDWYREEDPVMLPVVIPLDTWFGVRIEVRGTKVTTTVTVNGLETEIFSSPLLAYKTRPIDYPLGSVGFRQSSTECAHFRKVRVRRI